MTLRVVHLDAEGKPERITVETTIAEAAFIARLSGRMNDEQDNTVMVNGATVGREIYFCLKAFFSRFWEDGVDDAIREMKS